MQPVRRCVFQYLPYLRQNISAHLSFTLFLSVGIWFQIFFFSNNFSGYGMLFAPLSSRFYFMHMTLPLLQQNISQILLPSEGIWLYTFFKTFVLHFGQLMIAFYQEGRINPAKRILPEYFLLQMKVLSFLDALLTTSTRRLVEQAGFCPGVFYSGISAN